MPKSKLPEMLRRWNLYERLYDEFMRVEVERDELTTDQLLLYTDQLKAACTARGDTTDLFTEHWMTHDENDEIISRAWYAFDTAWEKENGYSQD